jgi:hypothetical protein
MADHETDREYANFPEKAILGASGRKQTAHCFIIS